MTEGEGYDKLLANIKHLKVRQDVYDQIIKNTKFQYDLFLKFLQIDCAEDKRDKKKGLEYIFIHFLNFENSKISFKYISHSIERPKFSYLDLEKYKDFAITIQSNINIKCKIWLKKNGKEYVFNIPFLQLPFMLDDGYFIVNGLKWIIVLQIVKQIGGFLTIDKDHIIFHVNSFIGFKINFILSIYKKYIYVEWSLNNVKISLDVFLLMNNFFEDRIKMLKHFFDLRWIISVNNIWKLIFNKDIFKIIYIYQEHVENPQLDKNLTIDKSLKKDKNVKLRWNVTAFNILTYKNINLASFLKDKCNVYVFKIWYNEEVLFNSLTYNLTVHENGEAALYYLKLTTNIEASKLYTSKDKALESIKWIFQCTSSFNLDYKGWKNLNFILKHNVSLNHLSLKKLDVLHIINLLNRSNVQYLWNNLIVNTDSLYNKTVKTVARLIYEHIFLVFNKNISKIKEQFELIDLSKIESDKFLWYISASLKRYIINKSIRKFFLQNELSHILDDVNTISNWVHKNKIVSLGYRGLSKEHASFDSRNIHQTYYGWICGSQTSEGKVVGLSQSLTSVAIVDEDGYILAPYFIIKKGKNTGTCVYLNIFQENNKYVAIYDKDVINNDVINLNKKILCRYNFIFLYKELKEIDYIEVTNIQSLSFVASLVPSIEKNDSTWILMATNMYRQALPLLNKELPMIWTKTENLVRNIANTCIIAKEDGRVVYVDSWSIKVQNDQRTIHYKLLNWTSTIKKTVEKMFPCVKLGQTIKKGDFLANNFDCKEGQISLGKNLLVALMPFYGENFEDSIVFNWNIIVKDKYISTHSINITGFIYNSFWGDEILTKHHPYLNTYEKQRLDEDGLIKVGSYVEEGDIVASILKPIKKEDKLEGYSELMKSILNIKYDDYNFKPTIVPLGVKGYVVNKRIIDKLSLFKRDDKVIKKFIITINYIWNIKKGYKFSGRVGNKHILSSIWETFNMPYLNSGRSIDAVISTFGIPSWMNLGQFFEIVFTNLLKEKEYFFFDAFLNKYQHIFNSIMLKFDRFEQDLYDGFTGEKIENKVTTGYLYVFKLEHMSEDKIQFWDILNSGYKHIYEQPLGGRWLRAWAQKIGEMELWSLLSYGAGHTVNENIFLKSGGWDKIKYLNHCLLQIKEPKIPKNRVSFMFKILQKHLWALGLDLSIFKKNNEKNNNCNTR